MVDRLERDGRGLNLCYETRMGILHHTHGSPEDTREATVVRLSDRIAYMNHDLDDALRAGLLQPEDVPELVRRRIGERNSLRINAITSDLIENSGGDTVGFSPEMAEAVELFHSFMYEAVYRNPIAKGEESKVENILRSIYDYYVRHTERLPAIYKSIADEEGIDRAVCDYVAGMTDKYAMYQYSELFIPAAWQLR